jgi:hypothetical protein
MTLSSKGDTDMKRITAIALFSIASLATSIGAVAQQGMKANIPFDFTVGNTKMPAGEYKITSPGEHEVRLQSANNASIATVVSLHSNGERVPQNELVFLKYGNRYFLHRVLSASSSAMDVDIATGKAEKEARSQEARLHTRQEVLVAAR